MINLIIPHNKIYKMIIIRKILMNINKYLKFKIQGHPLINRVPPRHLFAPKICNNKTTNQLKTNKLRKLIILIKIMNLNIFYNKIGLKMMKVN